MLYVAAGCEDDVERMREKVVAVTFACRVMRKVIISWKALIASPFKHEMEA